MLGEAFIRNLGVIVIAAALFSFLARPLRLPSIVAYLLAGLAIGPWTGLVELTGSLHLISETGIVLLLFLVGLELSFDTIKGVGKVVLIAGLAQMGFTACGGLLIAAIAGFSWVEAVFLAVAFTFSSTVVVVKMLEAKREFNHLHGRLSIGILLLQDLAVIVLLTLVSGLRPQADLNLAGAAWELTQAFGGMILLVVLVLFAAKFLLPAPFGWAARSPATLFVWSLCWCFLIVSLAHAFHLSPEIGAFLAGLGLAQLPYNHDLRRRVHPLTNFFIAVFFVSLGVEMQLGAAASQWRAALLFALFVLSGKFAILMWILARLRFGERTAHATATSLTQVSEFSFILAAAGVKAGWIDASLLSMVGLVGLFTFSASSFLITHDAKLYDWAHRRKLLRVFRARRQPESNLEKARLRGHVIVVGMNTLGRAICTRLHASGQHVLAVDVDPGKLKGLPCATLVGNLESLSVLEEAGLPRARLLVSALQIESTNDLLAYRCRSLGVPCSIHVVDLSVTDNLLEMDVSYLMIPKVDGIKLQTLELQKRGYLNP